MAFTASSNASEPRAFSIGPKRVQVIDISAANGDTTGTITADRLSRIDYIIVSGLQLSAAPTLSGNTATITFVTPPAATTIYGECLAHGV